MRFSTAQEGWFAVASAAVIAYFGFVNPAVGIWVGVAALGVFAWHEFSKRPAASVDESRRAKLWGLFKGGAEVTNSDVQKALGISDATATRYLEALEQEGLIRQIGTTGRWVYYVKK
ncbi:MAG TPA: winged helix-turn-helix domain-containing protein [Candidatus Paceibacterota bacterium]|nr:winged helix-turn-helix domain-containing protein [Candidatus Paceibacterota bacterium]